MKDLENFNVRAYAICENEGKILTVYEYYQDRIFCKLPGGGVEFGEGVIDCLRRELREELNVEIEIIEHLYTQEDYVESIVDDGRQILLIYYIVSITDPENMRVNTEDINRLEWIDMQEDPFWLPIDKTALKKFRERHLFKTRLRE